MEVITSTERRRVGGRMGLAYAARSIKATGGKVPFLRSRMLKPRVESPPRVEGLGSRDSGHDRTR